MLDYNSNDHDQNMTTQELFEYHIIYRFDIPNI